MLGGEAITHLNPPHVNKPNRSERLNTTREDMGKATPHLNRRVNTVIAGWACIAIGTGIALTDSSQFSLYISAPMSIGGIKHLMVGLSMDADNSLNAEDISSWMPEQSRMPDAGRPMFRVDTTLEGPIRTSILCGRCANIEWVDGPKPKGYTCPDCQTRLWEPEEE